MKRTMDWEDLRLFLAVARAGGLAGAAQATGVSAPTLGRRVAALEQDLNVRLVEREARGYRLTAAARDLMRHLEDMEGVADAIAHWKQGSRSRRRLRISAGDWTMRLLISHLSTFWRPDSDWVPEFLADLQSRDIARRRIDIGVRNARPKQAWLAGQKVGYVEYAVYQARAVPEGSVLPWAGLVEDGATSPTGLWLKENHGEEAVITLNKGALALSMVRQGHLRMVFPCFVGDGFGDLERVSEPIEALKTERWLVMHQDERHQPELRAAISELSKLLKQNPVLSSNG